MSRIYSADNMLIHTSRNLRGILDHARRTPVTGAMVEHTSGGAKLTVNYLDGSTGFANFADHKICHDWVLSRRSWGLRKTEMNATGCKFAA